MLSGSIYGNGSSLLIKNCCVCPVGAHLIWKYPLYRFLTYNGIDNKQRSTYKEVYMDVRGSIPDNLDEPSSDMKTVLDDILSRLPKKTNRRYLILAQGI